MFAFRDGRNRALTNWADGDLHTMAAAELLISHGYWPERLDEAGLLETWHAGTQDYARPQFAKAIHALEGSGEREYAFETCSSSEGDILYIAASLAVGYKINLSARLQHFDGTNSARVMRAIGIATRQVQV